MPAEQARLQTLLAEAISLDRAAKGNIQALDPATGFLKIVAHAGFTPQFLKHFAAVRPFDTSACGRAFGTGDWVLIPDVLRDEAFQPHRQIAQASGFRSVKSLPIAGSDGRALGVLSTHRPDASWDWERDNTLHIVAEIARILARRAAR